MSIDDRNVSAMPTGDQSSPFGLGRQWMVELQGLLLSTDGLESFLGELPSAAANTPPATAG